MAHFRTTPFSHLNSLVTKSSMQQELEESSAEAPDQMGYLRKLLLGNAAEKVQISHTWLYSIMWTLADMCTAGIAICLGTQVLL